VDAAELGGRSRLKTQDSRLRTRDSNLYPWSEGVGGGIGGGAAGEPVALEDEFGPVGGDAADVGGVGFDGLEGEADFHDVEFDGAAEAGFAEDELGAFFVEFVGDDEVLAVVDEFAGEEGEAAGGEVAGVDADPG